VLVESGRTGHSGEKADRQIVAYPHPVSSQLEQSLVGGGRAVCLPAKHHLLALGTAAGAFTRTLDRSRSGGSAASLASHFGGLLNPRRPTLRRPGPHPGNDRLNGWSTDGCNHRGHFEVPRALNTSTGRVRIVESAMSRYCPGPFNYTEPFPTTEFKGPIFTVLASGTFTAGSDWRITYNASLRAKGVGGNATAIVSIFAVGVI
jgi:hypothetical protein